MTKVNERTSRASQISLVDSVGNRRRHERSADGQFGANDAKLVLENIVEEMQVAASEISPMRATLAI